MSFNLLVLYIGMGVLTSGDDIFRFICEHQFTLLKRFTLIVGFISEMKPDTFYKEIYTVEREPKICCSEKLTVSNAQAFINTFGP